MNLTIPIRIGFKLKAKLFDQKITQTHCAGWQIRLDVYDKDFLGHILDRSWSWTCRLFLVKK